MELEITYKVYRTDCDEKDCDETKAIGIILNAILTISDLSLITQQFDFYWNADTDSSSTYYLANGFYKVVSLKILRNHISTHDLEFIKMYDNSYIGPLFKRVQQHKKRNVYWYINYDTLNQT